MHNSPLHSKHPLSAAFLRSVMVFALLWGLPMAGLVLQAMLLPLTGQHTVAQSTVSLFSCRAQRHIIYTDDIASLQVYGGIRWQELPVIRLGGLEKINISFDDLTHIYRRLTYTLTHLESDWTKSEDLLVSDYMTGFNEGMPIEDYAESINTLQPYTHYSLQVPNKAMGIKMSGNYRLDIRDDNDGGRPMLSVFFMVSEDLVDIVSTTRVDTDIDFHKTHQQVDLRLDISRLNATDPRRQIKGYVLQNNRWDDMRVLPQTTRLTPTMMEWQHCRDLIFEGGNEYHKFEMLDIYRNSLNVENNAWDGQQWHSVLFADEPRLAYVYDEVPKGAYILRNSNNYESTTTSEYINVHFTLKTAPLPYRVFVNGMWTRDLFLSDYEMHYDEELHGYTVTVPLKYGYYSYQYLMLPEDGVIEGDPNDDERAGQNTARPLIPPTEGSFYETRNRYTTLIYYRANIDRADRLVGVK